MRNVCRGTHEVVVLAANWLSGAVWRLAIDHPGDYDPHQELPPPAMTLIGLQVKPTRAGTFKMMPKRPSMVETSLVSERWTLSPCNGMNVEEVVAKFNILTTLNVASVALASGNGCRVASTSCNEKRENEEQASEESSDAGEHCDYGVSRRTGSGLC